MIKVEKIEVSGWAAAVRGMRNPMNSWDMSDTVINEYNEGEIGENDLKLMLKLKNAGTDHRKYLRMINVTLDITAPLYWWKEFDTYKIGTVSNSCSTMHKIAQRPLTLDDFSTEHMFDSTLETLYNTIEDMNFNMRLYNLTKHKKYWWQIIQTLPTSFNQKRTVQLNYEVLINMYESRHNHKLDEWAILCEFIKTLPYSELIV